MPKYPKHAGSDRSSQRQYDQHRPSVSQRVGKPRHGRPIQEVTSIPLTGNREEASDYSRRMSRTSYAKAGMRRHRRRNNAVLAGVIVIAILAAVIAAITVYFKDTNNNLSLENSNTDAVLVEPEEESTFVTLCSAEIGRPGYEVPDENKVALMLVRVDLSSKTMSFVTIPSSLTVKLSDLNGGEQVSAAQEYNSLAQIIDEYGEAALIKAVAHLTGIDINHFIATDSMGITELVTAVNGLEFTIETEIDDPNASVMVLESGDVELDGEKALAMLRATNIKGGFDAAAANRVRFTIDLLAKALDPQGLGFANILNDASKAIATDMDARYLLETGEKLKPLDSYSISSGILPYTASTSIADGKKVYSYSSNEIKPYMEYFLSGGDLGQYSENIDDINSAEVSVEIRNGAAIDGAGAALKDVLINLGYAIGEVGNTNDSTIYPETLIIYTKPENEGAAKSVQRDIQAGRIVNGGDFYTTNSDVLVVIGSDWR